MADTWLPLAHRLLRAAVYEAPPTEAACALQLAARLVAVPVSAVADAARRHPLAALGIGAAIALAAYQVGYLKRGRLRAAGQEIHRVAATGIEAFGNATDAYGKARQAPRVIEPYGTPTVEELAAGHLVPVRHPLPLDDLAAALETAGHAVSSAKLRDATSRHPAFRARASQPALTGIGWIAPEPGGHRVPRSPAATINIWPSVSNRHRHIAAEGRQLRTRSPRHPLTPTQRWTSSPRHSAGVPRPWPSVKQPTVRTDRRNCAHRPS